MKHHNVQPTPPKRVVILGANGFVARDLIRQLAESGIPHLAIGSAQVDLTTDNASEQLRQLIRADDAVVMTSALTPEKGKDARTFMKNVAMAASVCGLLETGRLAHLVYISSDAVYSDAQTLVSESTPRTGIGLYGLAHVAREQMLQFTAANAGVPLCIIRPCAIYGAGDTHSAYGPNRFLRSALRDGKISLFGNGEEERDHIWVEDLNRFILLVLARRSEGALHVANGAPVSFAGIAQMIVKLCPRPVTIENVARAPGAVITHRHFDVSRRRREFPGFQVTPLEEGLKSMARTLIDG